MPSKLITHSSIAMKMAYIKAQTKVLIYIMFNNSAMLIMANNQSSVTNIKKQTITHTARIGKYKDN